jgi:hypothetical protein
MTTMTGRLLCRLNWHSPMPGGSFNGTHMLSFCARCGWYVESRRGWWWRRAI